MRERGRFLENMEAILPFLVEFDDAGRILAKEYPNGCRVGGSQGRPLILITHDESVFSANDGKRQAWQEENRTFLRPKGKGKGIMVSEFLLPWARLADGKVTVLFEYGKLEGHWDGETLIEQIQTALVLAEEQYPGYGLVFFFDNATSHLIFADDALRVCKMSMRPGGQQPFLRDGWYVKDGVRVSQSMVSRVETESGGTSLVQKGIRLVLEERNLWPANDLRLECPKPMCPACEARSRCKNCVPGKRCDNCKQPKTHSGKCGSQRKCDRCSERSEQCRCTTRKACSDCAVHQGKDCEGCALLPSRCSAHDCCARRLLSLQPDFLAQQGKVKETIEMSGRHRVLFFPRFHCELNHIEYYWVHAKRYAREHCDYTLPGLRANVPLALENVKGKTILGNYRACLAKLDLHRQGVAYGSSEWRSRSSHQKPYVAGDDR